MTAVVDGVPLEAVKAGRPLEAMRPARLDSPGLRQGGLRTSLTTSSPRASRHPRGSAELSRVETIREYSNMIGHALSPRQPAEVLVWSDEFDYTGLPDPTRWSYQTEANAWTGKPQHREEQWYTAEREKNAYVSNGTLKLTARRENYAGCHYTSARLVTKGKGDWKYGRVEVSAKLPEVCRGAWPAIWMLPSDQRYGPWPRSGEIDLMENVGFAEGELRSSVHTERYNHREKSHKMGKLLKKSAHARFHSYCLEWSPTKIAIFVDNHCTLTYARKDEGGVHDPTSWPFDQRFHLVLNLAVGGHWAGQQGIDNSLFPLSMEIAYVRVYQRQNGYAQAEQAALSPTAGGRAAEPGAQSPLQASQRSPDDRSGAPRCAAVDGTDTARGTVG